MAGAKEQLDVVLRLFDDCRALIASGKIQRWEVTKWAVTANITLAVASKAVEQFKPFFLVYSFIATVIGIALLWHYNERMTKVRNDFSGVNAFIISNVININQIVKKEYDQLVDRDYDRTELCLLYIAVILSLIPGVFMIMI